MPNQPRATGAWRGWRPPAGLAGAAFWLAVWFGLLFMLRAIPGGSGTFFAWMQALVGLSLLALAFPLLWRMIRLHLLWSLRSRLVLTYLLIGLAPVVLFVTLAGISAYVAAGQFSIHLAETRVRQEVDAIAVENATRATRLANFLEMRADGRISGTPPANRQPQASPQATQADAVSDPLRERLHRRTSFFLNGAPLLRGAMQLPPGVRPTEADELGKTPLGLPPWAADLPRHEFRGLVLDGDELYLVAIQQHRIGPTERMSVITSLPVDGALLDMVAEGLGRVRVAGLMTGGTGEAVNPRGEDARQSRHAIQGEDIQRTSVYGGTEPPPVNLADLRVPFLSTLSMTDWDTGMHDDVPIEVDSRPSLLYRQLFGSSMSGVVTSVIRNGLVALCILFALIELLALVMALRVSRGITESVTELYDATQRVDAGDLRHRIAAASDDQLGELSRSFNRMTVSLERLLVEQKEKERLQGEISLGQEVQANLFPHHTRDLPALELHGVCRPARSVSGDYYDFLFFHEKTAEGQGAGAESGVGIALGDISGKGISAALLMATLHSAVRAYQFAGEDLVYTESSMEGLTANREGLAGDAGKLFESPGKILSLLNRHLYRSTPPEKYATLFLAHYDIATAQVTYSNAGQLPPLVLGLDGEIRRLDCGGTVVGLMDGMHYEQGRVQMQTGDILVAYSDGVTEPENDFGDFGEERLMEVVARYRGHPLHVISAQVMQALDAWIGAEEQPDDITLVLARQR
jgi:sigma-B regulation protein RsbU (phosphoserine phosphatase)